MAEGPHLKCLVHQYIHDIVGAKVSHTCAHLAIQRTSWDKAKDNPEAAKASFRPSTINNRYGLIPWFSENPERAPRKVEKNGWENRIDILLIVGFDLTKLTESENILTDQIDGSAQSTEPKVIVSSNEVSVHVLRQKRDQNRDNLIVRSCNNITISKILTQRLVLSLLSKDYKPIGLVAPFAIAARLIAKTQLADILHGASNSG